MPKRYLGKYGIFHAAILWALVLSCDPICKRVLCQDILSVRQSIGHTY